ncbi:protease HtpX [Thermobispora bispora]|uniref:Protease HtpX homolog n=1 Tax=Thermobispora bispora (strain ATCC 19993 / DSM 43833 / CBS 139.67 / JCM 10125 / KCTC 9307 / NBRC 14880 / R51) TaxID=469371 RepID=D6Y3M8_THEBD|nr:zinc metalloprotease HtpX [Thermobispora bispora]MBO2474395.1 zinc metalloprotease HtpX [Actinomycetales bacterium]MDI9582220.1 zinc metalloprotease HtpX [Thermobispora sp.]ADG87057.1 peptidase M48 Ste24p [Thermobispora bispora DSM 43833]MBX6169120.1 zinc metalloprotease HtpX [Thermobispora bispora]QSI47030.1 zinc metalloprotease HtpX [Thermobispora bispora]
MHHNGLRTAVLLGALSALLLAVGGWIGGGAGVRIAFVAALAVNGFAYFFSDRIALSAMRARPVSEVEQPVLYRIVRSLSTEARRPMPRLYLSPTMQPNAFATGRNPRNAAVCVTYGLLALLDERELRAVIGHELAHVYNRDILLSSVAGALATMITYVAQLGVFFGSDDDETPGFFGTLLVMILGPVAATMIQLAISRSREFAADDLGARLTGDPLALASALRKIELGVRRIPLPENGRLASASHMMIANPFRGDGLGRLFSTHPPTAERIARLERMAGYRR